VIGLDTNVLLRFLLKDDERQGEQASRAIRQAAARKEPMFVGIIVLCEVVWVLTSRYGYGRSRLLGLLEELLDTSGLEVERRDLVRKALDDYRASRADFADCLIGRIHEAHGCQHTLSFERPLKALDTFRVL